MTLNKETIIAAGLSSPELDVDVPARRKSTSFNAQVTELSAGETASRAQLIDSTLTVTEIRAQISGIKETLRNSLKKVTQRARETTGGEYMMEVTDVVTYSSRWFVIGLITRVA